LLLTAFIGFPCPRKMAGNEAVMMRPVEVTKHMRFPISQY
jgi:hypothetical protein